MKFTILSLLCLSALALSGCQGGGSDLSKDDRQKMDKLFRDGIKPGTMDAKSPSSAPSTDPKSSAPALNQPVDG